MGSRRKWYVPANVFQPERYEGREGDEARLVYLALTRAKELLVFSCFLERARKAAQPSRFLIRHLKDALAGWQRGETQTGATEGTRGDGLCSS